jgi:hypothetical protein
MIIIIIKRLKIIFLSVHILHARFVSQWLVAKPYCAHDLRWSSSGWLDRWQQVTYRGTADFIRIDIPTFTDRPTRTRARSNSRLYTIIHIGCRYIRNIIIIILYYFFFCISAINVGSAASGEWPGIETNYGCGYDVHTRTQYYYYTYNIIWARVYRWLSIDKL